MLPFLSGGVRSCPIGGSVGMPELYKLSVSGHDRKAAAFNGETVKDNFCQKLRKINTCVQIPRTANQSARYKFLGQWADILPGYGRCSWVSLSKPCILFNFDNHPNDTSGDCRGGIVETKIFGTLESDTWRRANWMIEPRARKIISGCQDEPSAKDTVDIRMSPQRERPTS